MGMPATGLFVDEGGPWERESAPDRVEHFDGGFVTRRRTVHASMYNWCPMSEASKRRIEHWYELLFVRLSRRLRYGGNKARNARRRLTLHWGSQGIPEALAYCRSLKSC